MPRKRSRIIHAGAALAFVVAVVVTLLGRSSRPVPPGEPQVETEPELPPSEVRTWKAAALRVEEARGAPAGRAASPRIPSQLRHYAQPRRFLAIQVAETEEQNVELPHDEAELVEHIRAQQLVRMPVLGEHYMLYGVGASASGEPFAHWDERSGARIPLLAGWAEFKDAEAAILAEIEAKKAEAAQRLAEARRTPVKQRSRRRNLQAQARTATREAATLETRRKQLASWYDEWDRRRLLVAEYQLLRDFARDPEGRPYDVDQPAQRRLMRARLLQHVRPEARDAILDLARGYHEKFGRPLPVTSLVRDEAYQRHLGRSNPNATTIDSPPHATGLAFDVHYGHMTAAEQEYLMDELARLESEARLEALRENRNHFHVFVFPDGQRPSERLIAESLAEIGPVARAATRTTTAKRKATSSRARTAASVKKAPTRKTAASVRKAPAKKAPTRRPARRSTRKPTRR